MDCGLSPEQQREYARAAYYYYKAAFSQKQIAQKMGMSRQRVNRILSECVRLGLVRITIPALEHTYGALEAELEERFSMEGVHVTESFLARNLTADLGSAAAAVLESLIREGDVIGVSRSRSTLALAESLPRLNTGNITVTQLMGSENRAGDQIAVDHIVYRFAERLRATPVMLYAPVIVQNEGLRRSITEEPFFRDSYRVIASCRIALVGIGSDTERALEHLRPLSRRGVTAGLRGAVGEICTHFFDAQGRPVVPPFRDHIVSISLDDYRRIPVRLGIAGGERKVRAIRAAMLGGYVNHLVTDLDTARLLQGD
ncbi:MAG: winged helix-turn-helix transcriptional regulator [Spirochaetaceae bacterium]|jgi:DNA-binding transcriptional regulator LsrR (DeoR family)|nr:winged helix-turn-helix transcriptional regulator [Spirochaetaceae bacterium]